MTLLLLYVSVPEPGVCHHMGAGPAGTPRLYGASLPVNMTGPQVTTACLLAHVAARPHMAMQLQSAHSRCQPVSQLEPPAAHVLCSGGPSNTLIRNMAAQLSWAATFFTTDKTESLCATACSCCGRSWTWQSATT